MKTNNKSRAANAAPYSSQRFDYTGDSDHKHPRISANIESDSIYPTREQRKAGSSKNASFKYGGGKFEVSPKGVYFHAPPKDGEEPVPKWVCSELTVLAKTRDAKSGEWGRLLEWLDSDNVRHQWAMPMELLQGDGSEVRKELARLGLDIAPDSKGKSYLANYLQACPVKSRARCVDQLGWHGDVYVTPSEAIGQSCETVVFQNAYAIEPSFSGSGTVDEWRDSVARMATGNSILVFSISCAFAGPLLDIAGDDSGGFHLRGGSSSGKSTALKAAASVFGNPSKNVRNWRATANGLEGLAALQNDGFLVLDELSQIDPREAGEAAYLLANGQGKARATKYGGAREPHRWRVLLLSAGEESLSGLMARAGKKANAGQEIRLADIPADAGALMGVFEALNGQSSPAALSVAVKDAAAKYHGVVGLEWLHRIVEDRNNIADKVGQLMNDFVNAYVPAGASGQVLRVANRFALVSVAGELASLYGLTGWRQGEATAAAHKCFMAWLESFGGAGNKEERAILSQVRAFFEQHGSSRFEDRNGKPDQRVINRAGFFENGPDETKTFYVLPESFKNDICQGYDHKTVCEALSKAGWIRTTDSKNSVTVRLPGTGPTRCYEFTAAMWEDALCK